MGTTLNTPKERNYLWDNIKALLIFTVVIGHFLETFPVNHFLFEGLDYWIYTFHMPAFLFVSGYWAKGYCVDGKVKAQKIGNFIAYYLIFQIIFFFVIRIFSPSKVFSIFEPSIGLWYLLSMIIYYLLIPLAEKLPAYIVLPVFIFIGLFIGTEKDAGTFMAISRTFVFAPFFFMGYYCPEKLINLLRNMKCRILIGITSMLTSVGICGAIIFFWSRKNFPMKLFYGKFNYDYMGFSDLKGTVLRLLSWVVSTLMILALILLIPKAKNFLSYVGKNSLQIYLFHFLLIIFFRLTDFTEQFPIDTVWQGVLLCLAGTAFTLLLSIKPLSYPFVWIQKLVDKIFALTKYNGKN